MGESPENRGKKIAEICGFETEQSMEQAMGIPSGSLFRTAVLMQNLINSCKEFNKNMLVLEGSAKDGIGTMTFSLYKTKNMKGDVPDLYTMSISFNEDNAHEGYAESIETLISLCREHDALTDMDLNTLGNPFFSDHQKSKALKAGVGEALVDFPEFSQSDVAVVLSLLIEDHSSKTAAEA